MSTPERARDLRDLEFLADVTRETLSSLQQGPLLWRVVQLLRHRFGYDVVTIGVVEGDAVVFRAGSSSSGEAELVDGSPDMALRAPAGRGIVGKVVETQASRLVPDVAVDPDFVAELAAPNVRSVLVVPIVHRDELLGVVDVQSERPAAFDETDLKLLEVVAALVGPAMHTARLYERERRRLRHFRLVNEMSRLVMSSLDREQVVAMACRAMLETLDISFAAVLLLDKTGRRLVHGGHATRLEFVEGVDFERLSRQLGEGVVSEVVTSGEPLRVGDVRNDPRYVELVKGVRSEICVPLRVRGRILGAVDVEHVEPHHFTEEDQSLLENLAGYLAQAIDNARLFDSQRRRWQQLLVINEVTRICTESIDLDQILGHVAEQVHDRFGYFVTGVWLSEEREMVLRALSCEQPTTVQLGSREPLGCGIAGRVGRTGQTVMIGGPENFDAAQALHPDVQSILCVPLNTHDRIIGAVEVQRCERDGFDDDDRLVLETLAKSVAGAIANARAIRNAEQLREDLNRMIVHDLRNPLQAVLLTLQEVSATGGDLLPGTVADTVREGVGSTEDILEMVNSLLDVARFEAGRAQLRLSPGALNDHLRAVVRRLAPLARSRGIQVTTVLSQDVPALRFDHELVSRMLHNLAGNALKFTPAGGRVTIRSEVVEDGHDRVRLVAPYVLVAVSDTGEGIPEEYHDKIFEKFGQVESRRAGVRMSTGLGLALCRYVVEAHGGEIWVQSQPGAGSTFFVALPTPLASGRVAPSPPRIRPGGD